MRRLKLARQDSSAEVRVEAIRQLADAKAASEVDTVLLAAARDLDPFARRAAALALASNT